MQTSAVAMMLGREGPYALNFPSQSSCWAAVDLALQSGQHIKAAQELPSFSKAPERGVMLSSGITSLGVLDSLSAELEPRDRQILMQEFSKVQSGKLGRQGTHGIDGSRHDVRLLSISSARGFHVMNAVLRRTAGFMKLFAFHKNTPGTPPSWLP